VRPNKEGVAVGDTAGERFRPPAADPSGDRGVGTSRVTLKQCRRRDMSRVARAHEGTKTMGSNWPRGRFINSRKKGKDVVAKVDFFTEFWYMSKKFRMLDQLLEGACRIVSFRSYFGGAG